MRDAPRPVPVVLDPLGDAALTRLLSLAAGALSLPYAWLWIAGEEQTLGSSGPSPGLAEAFGREVLKEGRLVVIENAQEDGRFMAGPGGVPLGLMAGAPLQAEDLGPIGALCLAGLVPRGLNRDEQDLLMGFAASARDCLGAEARLQRLEQKKRDHDRLLELSPDLICVSDAKGRFIRVNPAWERVLGYRESEMLGKRSIDFIHPDDLEETRARAEALRTGGTSSSYENRYRAKDGSYRCLQWSAATYLEEGLFYGIARDVTAWKEAQATIGHYDQQVQSLLHSITDALFTLDESWRFTYLNPQAETLLRRTDLVGKNLWEEFPAALDSPFELEYRRAMAERKASVFEAYYPPLRSWYEVHIYPSDKGLSIYFQDINARKETEQALKEANEFREIVMESVNEGIMALDLTGRFTLVNERLKTMLAFRDALGASLLELASQEARDQLMAMFETAARGTAVPAFETVLYRRDARPITVNLSFAPLMRGSSISGVVATAEDITETKEALDRLRLLSQAIEHIDEAVIITEVTQDGPREPRITYVNEAFCAITGYSREEAIGKPLRLLEGPESDKRVMEDFIAAQESETSFAARTTNYGKDGSTYVVDWRASAVRDETGRLSHWASVQTNVSDRAKFEATIVELNASLRQRLGELDQKNEELLRTARLAEIRKQNLEQAASELAKTARQLHTIFALSPDGFLSIDETGKVAYANEAFMRMTGLSPTQVIGKSEREVERRLQALCDPAQPCPSYLVDTETYRDTIYLIRPRPTVLRRMVRTLMAEDAELLGRVIYLRDVTHETEVDRMKSEFLSTAAHELRTPMTSIYGFSQLLLARDYDADTSRELITTIHDQSARLVQLLNELLDLARIEARAGKDFKMSPQPLVPILRETLRSFAKLEKHELKLELPDNLPQVVVDADKMQQVFTNVISNAIKYSPEGGTISVRAEVQDSRRVAVHVSDQGIGMTPEQVKRVCERFYRADSSGAIPGTGLGMSLVKEIMDIHGGALEIHSQPEQGTTVTLWLPAEEEA